MFLQLVYFELCVFFRTVIITCIIIILLKYLWQQCVFDRARSTNTHSHALIVVCVRSVLQKHTNTHTSDVSVVVVAVKYYMTLHDY